MCTHCHRVPDAGRAVLAAKAGVTPLFSYASLLVRIAVDHMEQKQQLNQMGASFFHMKVEDVENSGLTRPGFCLGLCRP